MERQEREVRAAAAPSEASERGYVDWGSILAGAAIAGAVYAFLLGHDETPVPLSEATEA